MVSKPGPLLNPPNKQPEPSSSDYQIVWALFRVLKKTMAEATSRGDTLPPTLGRLHAPKTRRSRTRGTGNA